MTCSCQQNLSHSSLDLYLYRFVDFTFLDRFPLSAVLGLLSSLVRLSASQIDFGYVASCGLAVSRPVCVNVCVFTGNSEFPEVRRMYFFISNQNRGSISNLHVETTHLISHNKNAFHISHC